MFGSTVVILETGKNVKSIKILMETTGKKHMSTRSWKKCLRLVISGNDRDRLNFISSWKYVARNCWQLHTIRWRRVQSMCGVAENAGLQFSFCQEYYFRKKYSAQSTTCSKGYFFTKVLVRHTELKLFHSPSCIGSSQLVKHT